ncbi:putative haloacid-halidohydrolase [Tothia fuscella]|uniref:Haloacid-halidohydrolase n=1 Tax=Tothia fuscella TaxID=1048955 RepID=A0A9P4NFL1_9PEZI|nr:putative haloacid-halidohydrolase [Tothia fuscella]
MKISPHLNLPVIRACLFDMDGLLIDSEDKYTLCTNEILREFGKPNIPWSIKAQLQGRPGPEASKIFQKWAQLPIPMEEFYAKTRALQAKHFPSTKPLPGAETLLSTIAKADPPVHIALATSSHAANFVLKTTHLEPLFSVFTDEHRVLGDDTRIPPGRGKPAPDIYTLALKTINDRLKREGEDEIYPEECLVFEDSVPGVEAGRRAGMQVIWCPHEGLLNEFRGREKEVLAGLMGEHVEDVGQKVVEEVKEDIPGKEQRTHRKVRGEPGEIDDGWAKFVRSLEDFPYEWYGIKVDKGGSSL